VDPGRFRRIALAALLFTGAALAQESQRRGTVKLLVQSSPLAGFGHYEAARVWGELRLGDPLELAREPENPHDPRAIRVAWRGHLLGYVPRRANGALAWAMDRGESLTARVSRLVAHPNPAKRLEFEVFVE
jgi:hypothetical protein